MTIRWICERRGCYKDYCIPDWGFLDDTFPGRIRVSDVDGTVELDGSFLFLEWKGDRAPLSTGQRIYHERLTSLSDKITVYIIWGNVSDGTVSGVQIIRGGSIRERIEADRQRVARMCRLWANSVSPGRMR